MALSETTNYYRNLKAFRAAFDLDVADNSCVSVSTTMKVSDPPSLMHHPPVYDSWCMRWSCHAT